MTTWTADQQASLSITNSWSLLKFMSIVSVMPSNYLILYHHFLLPSIFPNIRVFSNESALHIRWPKYWSFSSCISSFQWIFSVDFLKDCLVWSPCCTRDSQESSPAPQFRILNSLVLSLLYGPTLTWVHDYTKTIALTIWAFVSKVIYLLFNRLSSLSWLSFQGTSIF